MHVFLKLFLFASVCACVCVCVCVSVCLSVCPPQRAIITSGVIWCDLVICMSLSDIEVLAS